ncbi:NADH-quinone oxidoreductase subunit NuoH [Photobacterium phosphoreum]|uniref:NADH-quinone oxidoreductase subunit NuoH n=1 Tax=Photobacterium phosphoreum TaxID=659 RepID=UPI0007F886CA|nr:NADH-quinone oxidoreductase subunit NuoH [Photobacterium phosphoreum]MCD9471957.1 NADH-quinone oxidoreductase subunit NuoH [Photobacterium phosphoreum]MCD9477439.1 NADH-quinone oxidoreductase subunit NuoH [Photobacterium phosphoreum]MCD9503425.1 NADH-quinone oxidoreductase subunit NuoH [Photobacterium phosphoreum]MCD9519865.1 NADH-quinone oxidoreductase subunit NuoH [Photobacterium phosphoreum]OBU33447.1 NADH-quinone oxidoreductase subunit H [Photobacterium phosphoreum]
MSEFSYWILMIIGMIVTILGLILVAGYTVLFERRCLALLQDRYGPNRAGPLGLFQAIFDALKLLTKEYFLPGFVDKRLYILAPLLVVVAILVSFALLPIGQGISWAANLNIGLLFLLGLSSIHAYGVFLGGWASNSKYTMLGAIRTIAQLISYELAMGIAVLGVVMLAGSFSLSTIVDNQTTPYIFLQPIGFIVFFIAGIAETHRLPFDMPEAENELNAGFNTEYGGMPFAMFFLGEYLGVILVGAMTTTLYLGGWHGPGAETYPLLGVGWFVLKTFLLVFFFVWMRASVPRTRYDQLMVFGWKYLLPIGLVNILLTAIVGAFWM